MKRLLSLFLVLAAVLPALTGCKKNNANDKNPNNTDTPSVTLKVWGAQDDQAILRDMCNAFAQAHPEKHRDLIVRVAGYSAFFNVLSKATQDDIIDRTEQVL